MINMKSIKNLSELHRAVENGTIGDVLIHIDIIRTKTRDEFVIKKIKRFTEMTDILYPDLSVPLKLYHKKMIQEICTYIENTIGEEEREIMSISESMLGTSICSSELF